MYAVREVSGYAGGACFLIRSEKGAVLFDAGLDFRAERTAAHIEAVLGARAPDYILLSHSHYDHASGSAILKRRFPASRVAASAYAAAVFARPGARALMRQLNAWAAEEAGETAADDRIDDLRADLTLNDGDLLACGDMHIRALSTPGHTKCSMSYYFMEDGLLAASETVGVPTDYPSFLPCLIVGYRMTLESIDKSEALRPKRLLLPHVGLVRAEGFFDRAREAAATAVDIILRCRDEGRGEEETVSALKARFYNDSVAKIQPERAYLLNTRAMVGCILAELG